MPKYVAIRDTWLSHESRLVKTGEEFDTEFPKVLVDGKLVPMKLSGNIELVKPAAEQKAKPDSLA
jgi:hypothetical protein